MLRKLGRRLTLVNLLVSGAILVMMALLALGVSEGMIGRQYEADLSMYARSAVGAIHRAQSGSILYQVPDRYMVYVEGAEGTGHVLSGDIGDATMVKKASAYAKNVLEEETGEDIRVPLITVEEGISGWQALAGEDENSFYWQRAAGLQAKTAEPFPEVVPSLDSGRAMPATLAVSVKSLKSPYLVTDEQGTPLRMTASLVLGGNAEGLILIFQDRTDEMAARVRMRWLFGGCIAAGLLLITLASMYLSGRAIRPIEESMEKQRAFVAAASHELRTPVAAIRANAEVLADAPLGEFAPYLESIQSVSQRMSMLISDLMDLARADAGELAVKRTPVDADQAAAAAVQWMRPLAEKRGVSIVTDIRPLVAIGDADRLRQALVALLDNALRYTATGGEVFVQTARDGKSALVAVADTGPGIPDEHKGQVFDRFYRVDTARDRESGGFGLGLSVVKQLVEQMGGTVTLADREGGGALFTVRLGVVE